MEIKIKNISEFCKLYKINIPVDQEFDYYISTLLKSSEYKSEALQKQLNDFAQLEKTALDNNFESVGKLKMRFLDTVVDYIKATSAYASLLNAVFPNKQLNTKDWTSTLNENDFLLSVDFKSANYSVLKTFDNAGELKDSWRSLCESLLIPEALIESKSFRQIVYGNCSPKRLQTFQHGHIITITEELRSKYSILEENLIFISHDEFIIKISPSCENLLEEIQKLKEQIAEIKLSNAIDMPLHFKPFKLEKIGKNKYVKSHFSLEDNLQLKYKSLLGIPGNKFYMYFKKYILNESIEKRDLYFINDGELATWVVTDVPK